MKRLVSWFLLAALVLPSVPARAADQVSANFMVGYDLDATDATYCRVIGDNGSPFSHGILNLDRITTSGSSTTTSEVTDTDPFTDLSVNDVIEVTKNDGSTLLRTIAVRTSASAVVVDSAWNIEDSTGYVFRWWKTVCGTGAEDGWISVAGADTFSVIFQLDQVNATGGIDVQIQCRAPGKGKSPVQVFPDCESGACATYQNYTTAGVASATAVVGDEPWGECRIGVKIGSADDGGDLTTNAERITGILVLEKNTR